MANGQEEFAALRTRVERLEDRVFGLGGVSGDAIHTWGGPSATVGRGVRLPSVPNTPARTMDSRMLEDEAFSIYSHATSVQSHPAAYLQAAYQARKIGPQAAPWGPDTDVASLQLSSLLLRGSSSVKAAAGDGVPADEHGVGVLGFDSLQRVRETVGTDLAPWIQALSADNSTTLDTQASQLTPYKDASHKDTDATAAHDDDIFRRQTRDQVQAAAAATGSNTKDNEMALQHSSSGSSSQLLACVALLAACQTDEAAREQVWEAGAVPTIMALLTSSSPADRRVSSTLLWYLSRSAAAYDALDAPQQHTTTVEQDALPSSASGSLPQAVAQALVKFLEANQEDMYAVRAGALALNNLVAQHPGVHSAAVADGAVHVLVTLLGGSGSMSVGQEAAAAALLGLTSQQEDSTTVPAAGKQACTQLVQLQGALQVLNSAMRYGDPAVQEHLAGVMQNVSMSVGPAEVQALLSAGCLNPLLDVARTGSTPAQEAAISALGNLAAELPAHGPLVAAGCINLLAFIIRQPLPATAYGTPGAPSVAAANLSALLEATMEVAQLQASALLALCNLCTGKLPTKQAILDKGGAAALLLVARGAEGVWPTALRDAISATAGGAAALSDLAEDHPSQQLLSRLDDLEEHVAEAQSWALSSLLSLSSEVAIREPLVLQVRAGPCLMGVLLGGAPQAKELAAKTLTNLSIPDACKPELVAKGAAMVLVPLVRAGSNAGRQAACRALQNLAKLSSNRSEIAACGAVRALLDAVAEGPPQVFEAAAAALHTLCNHIQVLNEVASMGGASILLSVVRAQHSPWSAHGGSSSSSRGVKLLTRLLHRLVLMFPHVQQEVASEVAALGLI